MTDHDLLSKQAFEHELLARGQTVTVKLAEGQRYEGIVALVGDEEVGVVTHDGGVDEIPARLVRLADTVTDDGETKKLEFAAGAAIAIGDDGGIDAIDWAVEKVERRFTWGALELMVTRSKQIDSTGRTNRRSERYGAGGRLRSRY